MSYFKSLWAKLTPERIQCWITSIGGRRFLLCVGAGIVSSLLVWYTKITPEVYRDIVIGTVGLFIAGNTTQKGIAIVKENQND